MIAAMTGTRLDGATTPFDEVYRDHADAVYRFCVSQLRDRAAAEDVCSDVFASAYAAYARVRPEPSGVTTWLFRIARNAVIDQRRREGRRGTLLARLGAGRGAVPARSVEDDVSDRDDLRRVLAALDHLGRRDRQLVGLRVAGGLSFAEVAAVCGIRENAARTATHRALQRVRAAMDWEDT